MKLHNLINPKLGLEIKDNRVTLLEKQTERNALKEVIICQIPKNVFFFKMDQ
jgi:recombinational DNA repair protein RecR